MHKYNKEKHNKQCRTCLVRNLKRHHVAKLQYDRACEQGNAVENSCENFKSGNFPLLFGYDSICDLNQNADHRNGNMCGHAGGSEQKQQNADHQQNGRKNQILFHNSFLHLLFNKIFLAQLV